MPTLDEYSVTALPLTQMCKGNAIGRATGFFYRHQDRFFLVSNWHVFSGRNPYTGQALHKSGATPDAVCLPLHTKDRLGHFSKGHTLALEGANAAPTWLQHPRGQDIDVAVALIASLPPASAAYELPRPSERTDMAMTIAMDCFVLGFPKGISHGEILPIWKRASIATEPDVPHDNLPVFLIDTATREGMSGAPVVLRSFGGYGTTDGSWGMGGGAFSRFVGVYSGQFKGADELEAQLGRVWHRAVIEEIIVGGIHGSYQLR